MAAFAQFGSDLDKATQEQLANGQRLTEMLKQPQYAPMPMEEQVISIYAATPQDERDSWVRKLEGADLQRFESEMLAHIRAHHSEILETIRKSQRLEEEVEAQLIAALDGFAEIFQPSAGSDAA
jgi:F-type H+-transporting ATPase subunit alpha